MSKTKVLFGLAVIAGLLAVSVTPASAWFEAANGKSTTGKASGGKVVFTDEGATIQCEGYEIEWAIRERTKQALTSRGQHLNLRITVWKICTAFGFNASIKSCEWQWEHLLKGSPTATWADTLECVAIAIGNCELKIGATKANEDLKSVGLTNAGANLEGKDNVSGITSTATSLGGFGCIGVKNLKNNVGELKGIVIGEGVKTV